MTSGGSPRTSGALSNPETRLFAHQLQCSYTFSMSTLRFEWDERKSAANAKKHGVSFEEAKSVFVDEQAKLIDDPDHSHDEDRFVLLSLRSSLRLLVVCHCYRDDRQHHSLHLCSQGNNPRIQVLSVEVPHAQRVRLLRC